MHVIFTITRRLILRSVTTGALVGLIVGIGVFIIDSAQVALNPEQFAGWNAEPRQSVIFALGGAIAGTGLGLVGGFGAVFLLRSRAAVTEPDRMRYAGTAGLGAGAVTAACTVLVLTGAGAALWVSTCLGAGLGTVLAIIAGLQTRRLLAAPPPRTR